MSKKSKTTSGPSAFAKPYITAGANAAQSVYNQQQPRLNSLTQQLDDVMPQIVQNATDNPTLGAANDYTQGVLSGNYLNGNQYLDSMVQQTGDDVQNRVNESIGARGRTGGDAHSAILSKELADAENTLRYNNYNTERGYQQSAASNAASLAGAQNQSYATLLAALQQGADLPWTGTNNYTQSLAGLLGNAQTQTSSPSTASSIMNGVGTAASIASLFSDRRLKMDVERVGEMDDGLGIYEYAYVWGGGRQRGVMADEVAKLRPWALGPVVGGYATVNYGAL